MNIGDHLIVRKLNVAGDTELTWTGKLKAQTPDWLQIEARFERYNRNRDPAERSPDDVKLTALDDPIPHLGPSKLTDPLRVLHQHRTTAQYAPLPDKTVDVDDEDLEKLKALGYVQ